MAPRRSARLRGGAPVVEPLEELPPRRARAAKKLQPVVEERNETPEPEPESKQTNETVTVTVTPRPDPEPFQQTNETITSPKNIATPSSKTSQPRPQYSVKTPNTSGFLKLGLEDMHPSKVQKSTAKKPDPSLVLGFKPIEADSNAPGDSHSAMANTPSKRRQSILPAEMDSLSFDFKFTSEDTKLSGDARKLMENIREDAARIKAEMIKEKKTSKRKDEDEGAAGDRKFAMPKGRASRFSQAHMSQFKKMDSIAGHPSSFRARPNSGQPGTQKSLKRTISKARLDEPEKTTSSRATATPKPAASSSTTPTPSIAKRRKESSEDDAAKRRPLLKDDHVVNRAESKIARPTPGSLATPQKPTIAPPTSIKPPNTTKIPAIARSPSHKSLQPPRTPQTDFRAKYQNGTPKLTNLKSILRRRQPLFSNDPTKIAAGTHLPAPTPEAAANPSPSASMRKQVEFSASTKDRHNVPEQTPSKTPTARNETTATDVVYPTLPPITPPTHTQEGSFTFEMPSPSVRKICFSEKPVRRSTMTNRPGIPHGISNKKRHREETEDEAPEPKRNSSERVEDTRSAKRMKTNPTATPSKVNTPSPIKSRPIPQTTTPRRNLAGNSLSRKSGLSLSRLSFLSRPKARR